ncbi:MAG: tRNA (guanosine(37)-N1)-methyltransferase TrmD [Pseudonocardiales bacterium]
MRIDVITIFPRYIQPLSESLLGKARDRGLVDLRVHDLRRWTDDVHRSVDAPPYGGGPGMLMRPEPWARALAEVCQRQAAPPLLIVPTPAGRPFTQARAREYAEQPWLVFACGRYEGIDTRVVQAAQEVMRVDEVSIGDYVLSGGEAAALVMVEAVTRLVSGVVGNADSVLDDSFAAGLLEAPGYTRPEVWAGRRVPAVLLSGDHARIARWRRDAALLLTARRRPDLLAALSTGALDAHDLAVLAAAGFRLPPDDVAP